MTEALLVLIKLSVGALILATGMRSTFTDLTYLWRRPRLLFPALLAMYVLVPLAALLLVKTLPLSFAVKAALLVLAVSAGAPLLPRKLGTVGSDAYAFSLVVTSSLLAIVLVPAWIALLSHHFDAATEVSLTVVAAAIAKSFLLPLAIGMAIRAALPKFGERFADRLLAGAGIVLMVSGLVLIVAHWELLLALRGRGMFALIGLMLVALAIGHVLGGPDPGHRAALALACSTRHIAIAVIVATAFPGPRALVLIAAYVIASAAVSIPYLYWRRRGLAARGA